MIESDRERYIYRERGGGGEREGGGRERGYVGRCSEVIIITQQMAIRSEIDSHQGVPWDIYFFHYRMSDARALNVFDIVK